MSKLSAYTYYQKTTSPAAGFASAAATAANPTAPTGTASAAVVEISDAVRQAATHSKELPSTNTIWGSAPHK